MNCQNQDYAPQALSTYCRVRIGGYLRPQGTDRRRGFTLIELLVVIAVIALLLSGLLPALQGTKRLARSTICSSQMRQITLAVLIYAQENSDDLPRSSHSASAVNALRWGQAIVPYLDRGNYQGSGPGTGWDQLFNSLYRCPADRRRNASWSYGKNVWFELEPSEMTEVTGQVSNQTYDKLARIRNPSTIIWAGETTQDNAADHVMCHFWLAGGEPEIDTNRHGKVANFSYLDGRVQSQPFAMTFDLDEKIDRWNPSTKHYFPE